MGALNKEQRSSWLDHPLLRKYTSLVREDLATTYSRDIQKWLLVAPIIGIITGLVITALTLVILSGIWHVLLPFILTHHWAILPVVLAGFLFTGLIMQYETRDPDEHSTEEIIRSYHEHQGDIDIRAFWWKLLAAITTVGLGGSAALEGPSIYGGGAIGSWLWAKLRRFGLDPRDRRIMLISGAGAGMAAVFRAPLTGLIFALEMPYKDDLAHEALLPSLIAAVVAYATLVSIVGTTPLFAFKGTTPFEASDLLWSALLGLICGLIAMVFTITFRRVRTFAVRASIPHVSKLLIGGFLTAICGIIFIGLFPGKLIPLGPNYEAVDLILRGPYAVHELIVFAVLKLGATLFSLGSGGVSAMFVPLFLCGGAFGRAFAELVVHHPSVELYAAVGMASFIAAGYKTPLTAVIFVAETTGGTAYLIPSLIGAAVAYAVSGESSASGDQKVHEAAHIAELSGIPVGQVMSTSVVSVDSSTTLRDFAETVAPRHRFALFPVEENQRPVGLLPVWKLAATPAARWTQTTIGEVMEREVQRVGRECDLMEALRLLSRENAHQMLFVMQEGGKLEGIVTKTDILSVLGHRAHAGTG